MREKKGRRIIIIILCLLILAGGLLVGLKEYNRRHLLDGPGMERDLGGDYEDLSSFSYVRTGGMEDEYYELTLIRLKEDQCEITEIDQKSHDAKREYRSVVCDRELIDQVIQIMEAYHMPDWQNFPDSEIYALDEATTYISYRYGGKDYDFSSNQEFPEGAYKGIRELLDLMISKFE